MKTGLIMLAAGNSRRFGSNKLLHEIEGKPMYLHVLELLLKVQKQTENCKLTVVTQYPEIKKTAERYGAEVYLNPTPERGIASSLVMGLEASKEMDCFCSGRSALAYSRNSPETAGYLQKFRKGNCSGKKE